MTIPIPTLNSSNFYDAQKNQAIFEAHKDEVDFNHPHKYQVNFDPDAQTKSVSILYIHQKQVPFGPNIDTNSISVPRNKTNSISIHTLKSSQLQSPGPKLC